MIARLYLSAKLKKGECDRKFLLEKSTVLSFWLGFCQENPIFKQ